MRDPLWTDEDRERACEAAWQAWPAIEEEPSWSALQGAVDAALDALPDPVLGAKDQEIRQLRAAVRAVHASSESGTPTHEALERLYALVSGESEPSPPRITDEMVERADSAWRQAQLGEWPRPVYSKQMRAALEAALGPSPPPDPTVGLPPDLVRVLRDPTIVIDKDREIVLADGRTLFDHLQEWRNAPSNTASADPLDPSPRPQESK